jgi:hypothetical protein
MQTRRVFAATLLYCTQIKPITAGLFLKPRPQELSCVAEYGRCQFQSVVANQSTSLWFENIEGRHVVTMLMEAIEFASIGSSVVARSR